MTEHRLVVDSENKTITVDTGAAVKFDPRAGPSFSMLHVLAAACSKGHGGVNRFVTTPELVLQVQKLCSSNPLGGGASELVTRWTSTIQRTAKRSLPDLTWEIIEKKQGRPNEYAIAAKFTEVTLLEGSDATRPMEPPFPLRKDVGLVSFIQFSRKVESTYLLEGRLTLRAEDPVFVGWRVLSKKSPNDGNGLAKMDLTFTWTSRLAFIAHVAELYLRRGDTLPSDVPSSYDRLRADDFIALYKSILEDASRTDQITESAYNKCNKTLKLMHSLSEIYKGKRIDALKIEELGNDRDKALAYQANGHIAFREAEKIRHTNGRVKARAAYRQALQNFTLSYQLAVTIDNAQLRFDALALITKMLFMTIRRMSAPDSEKAAIVEKCLDEIDNICGKNDPATKDPRIRFTLAPWYLRAEYLGMTCKRWDAAIEHSIAGIRMLDSWPTSSGTAPSPVYPGQILTDEMKKLAREDSRFGRYDATRIYCCLATSVIGKIRQEKQLIDYAMEKVSLHAKDSATHQGEEWTIQELVDWVKEITKDMGQRGRALSKRLDLEMQPRHHDTQDHVFDACFGM